MEKKLHRNEQHKMIAGVCSGLAEYFSVDVTIVRILFIAMLILHGGGFLLYVVLWIVLPVKAYSFINPTVDYRVPGGAFGNPPPFGNMPPQNPGDPFMGAPKHRSSGTVIVGTILVIIGSFFLLDEFDIIPDWDFSRLWPVSFILVGLAVMMANRKKQPWHHDDWHNTNTDKKEETTNDNPPIV